MNFTDALSKIAPAVGDGKIVWQHTYIRGTRPNLMATDGRMWATFVVADWALANAFCVRYDGLKSALQRPGASVEASEEHGLLVRAGRSRTKIKGIDPTMWPACPSWTMTTHGSVEPPPEFLNVLSDFAPFMGKQDNHIWQMGIHLTPDMAYVCNPFAVVRRRWQWEPGLTVTIPAWAVGFLTPQDTAPSVLVQRDNFLSFVWHPEQFQLSTSLLVEEPSEPAQMLAGGLSDGGGVPVPDGLKNAVARLSAIGATSFQLGRGKLSYISDANREGSREIEIEEDIDLDVPTRTWSVKSFLQALEHADTLDFSASDRLMWHGAGYDGVFSGMVS